MKNSETQLKSFVSLELVAQKLRDLVEQANQTLATPISREQIKNITSEATANLIHSEIMQPSRRAFIQILVHVAQSYQLTELATALNVEETAQPVAR